MPFGHLDDAGADVEDAQPGGLGGGEFGEKAFGAALDAGEVDGGELGGHGAEMGYEQERGSRGKVDAQLTGDVDEGERLIVASEAGEGAGGGEGVVDGDALVLPGRDTTLSASIGYGRAWSALTASVPPSD